MNLHLNQTLADQYRSPSQRIRVLTEHWFENEVYCPNCGYLPINLYENNRPVADFYCQRCDEDYELKSKRNAMGTKIVDGAYCTMLERLTCSRNPNLFLLNYDFSNYKVANLFVIPKHFFVPEIIERRKPLAINARRAGWVGCNILLDGIPQSGKIFLVKTGRTEPKVKVLEEWKKHFFFGKRRKSQRKGGCWM